MTILLENNKKSSSKLIKNANNNILIKEVINCNIKNNIEHLRFDLKQNKELNNYNTVLLEQAKLINKIKKKLQISRNKNLPANNILFNDAEITFDAIKWLKKNLLFQLSNNNSNTEEIKILKSKELNLNKIINDKNKEISTNQIKIEKLKTEIKKTEDTIKTKNHEIQKINEQTSQKNKILTKKFQTDLEKSNKKLNQIVKEKNLECSKEKEKTGKKISIATKKFQSVAEKMEIQINRKKIEMNKIKTQNQNLRSQIQDKEHLLKVFGDKLKIAKETELKLRKKKQSSKEEISLIKNKIAQFYERISEKDLQLKTEKNLHNISKRELETHSKKIETLYKKNEILQKDYFEEKSRRTNLKIELTVAKKSLNDLHESKSFASKTQQDAIEKIHSLKLANSKLENQQSNLKKTIEKLKDNNLAIRNFYDKNKKKGNSINKNKSNLSLETFFTEQIDDYRKQINQLESNNQKLQENINKIKSEKERFEHISDQNKIESQRKISNLQQKIRQNVTEKSTEGGDDKINNKTKNFEKKINKLNDKNQDYQRQILEYKRLKNESEASNLKLRVRIESLSREMDRKNNEIKHKNAIIEKLNKNGSDDESESSPVRINMTKNLFEIYGDNSKKAKNIIDEELSKLKRKLDHNVYKPKSKLPNKSIKEKISQKNPMKLSPLIEIDSTNTKTLNKRKEERLKKNLNKKKNVKKNTKKTLNGKYSQNVIDNDNLLTKSKKLSLRERIEMSKDL